MKKYKLCLCTDQNRLNNKKFVPVFTIKFPSIHKTCITMIHKMIKSKICPMDSREIHPLMNLPPPLNLLKESVWRGWTFQE